MINMILCIINVLIGLVIHIFLTLKDWYKKTLEEIKENNNAVWKILIMTILVTHLATRPLAYRNITNKTTATEINQQKLERLVYLQSRTQFIDKYFTFLLKQGHRPVIGRAMMILTYPNCIHGYIDAIWERNMTNIASQDRQKAIAYIDSLEWLRNEEKSEIKIKYCKIN